jgi:hypothetical protein
MKRERDRSPDEEPVGIVISQGSRETKEPRFSAYVWSAVPTPGDGATKAA